MKLSKYISCLLLLTLLLGCCAVSSAEADWNASDTPLTVKLETFGFIDMKEIRVGKWSARGVEADADDVALSVTTEGRTVTHGATHTACVELPLAGPFNEGDTVVVNFAVKNDGEGDTNFLVDVYSQGDETRSSWLTRSYVFSPTREGYTEYYLYAIAKDTVENATLEFNMGWSTQALSMDYVQAAKYPGSIREKMLESLPLMSRKNVSGEAVWHSFYDVNASWRKDAQLMIEQNRMGQLTVQVTDASGNPLKDASVQVDMLSHAYKFGSATSASSFLTENADSTFAVLEDYFNIQTFANDLKWGDPNWTGVGTNRDTYDALTYLIGKGMAVHGHVLLWPGTDRDPYDDGVDQTAEFVTSPSFVVHTVRIIQAMQRMTDPSTGYGDGTIGTLRKELNDALVVYGDPDGKINDDLTRSHVETVNGMAKQLLDSIKDTQDSDTSLEGVAPTLAEFQSALRNVLLEHIADYASYYGQSGAIVEWDVINEVMNAGYRGVINAIGEDAYSKDKTKLCHDPILVDAFKAARAGAGDGILLSYNDTQWQSNGQQRISTYSFLKYLAENDAPIDFFGLQAYVYPQSIGAMLNPKENWEEYDKIFALGIGTEITEYSPSGFEQVLPEAERLNMFKADFLSDYLTVNFAHPGSIGFIAWGGIPTSGPVSSVYYKLVYDEWWTNEQLITNENGAADVQAFLGEYQITVTTVSGHQTVVNAHHLNANASQENTVITVQIK